MLSSPFREKEKIGGKGYVNSYKKKLYITVTLEKLINLKLF